MTIDFPTKPSREEMIRVTAERAERARKEKRKQLGVRCDAETPAKLSKLALDLGFYTMRHGEKIGAINQLFDAIASGEIKLQRSKGA